MYFLNKDACIYNSICNTYRHQKQQNKTKQNKNKQQIKEIRDVDNDQ